MLFPIKYCYLSSWHDFLECVMCNDKKRPVAMTIKSFCRTFFKKFVGSRGKAPCGIFKGEALKLKQNLRKQILLITI